MVQLYAPIAEEVIRSLVWTNISWANLSTSITNRSTLSVVHTPNRASTHPQMWFESGIGGPNYIDVGAELDSRMVEVHIFLRPTSDKPTTVGNYKTDLKHIEEEVVRVVRQNRTNASGYEFIKVQPGGIIPLNIENDPTINPPYLETLIRVNLRKIREALT